MHVTWHEARAHCKRSNISRSAWFSDLAHIPDLCWTTVMIGLAWLSGISAVPGCRGLRVAGLKVRKERAARCWKRGGEPARSELALSAPLSREKPRPLTG